VLPSLYALPSYDFDLCASHARALLPAALDSLPFGFVSVRVRVMVAQVFAHAVDISSAGTYRLCVLHSLRWI